MFKPNTVFIVGAASSSRLAGELRRLARSVKFPRTSKRMLAIANALEGMHFTEAARVVGMERQALGDAVQRYNAEGL